MSSLSDAVAIHYEGEAALRAGFTDCRCWSCWVTSLYYVHLIAGQQNGQAQIPMQQYSCVISTYAAIFHDKYNPMNT